MTRAFVRHPVTTWMIFAAFVVMGIYSLPRLEIEALPELGLPTLTVRTTWQGASPKTVQRSITLPIEEAAGRIHGVENIESTSRAGESVVEIEFRRDTDVEFARLDLNEQLGAVRRTLPLNAGQPEILPYVPEEFSTDDFFLASLDSDLDANDLREKVEDWVVPRVLSVDGVADARVVGGARPLLKIFLDRTALRLHGITADEVFRALQELDALSAAGVVSENGEEKLVALREPLDLARISNAVIARRGGRQFTLDMLGRVEPAHEDPTMLARANGRDVVRLEVEKRNSANAVSTSRELREALADIQATVPFTFSYHIDEDLGEDLEQKLTELVSRSCIILVVLFVILALTLRAVRLTAIVTGSIFFALVISLSLFYFLGLSVNFITISGLTICFGLILDNGILVLDGIHRRIKTLYSDEARALPWRDRVRLVRRAIVAGTDEVTFPVMATTLTTIVAFLSFIFLSGRLALYYRPLAVAVGTAMLASIFVAFAWIPVVLNQTWARSLVGRRPADEPDTPVEDTIPDDDASRERSARLDALVADRADLESRPSLFQRGINWMQRLWWVIVPGTIVLLWWTHGVYDTKVYKGGFFRMPDMQQIFVRVEMPAGTDVAVTSETIAKYEQALLPIPEGARMRTTVVGNVAMLHITFEEELVTSETPLDFRGRLVDEADRTGGASVLIFGFADSPYLKGNFGGSPLNSLVEISGYNSKRLNAIAEEAARRVQRNRRVRNARVSTGNAFERAFLEETVISFDRDRLAENGFTVIGAAAELRRILGVDIPWSMVVDGSQEQMQLGFMDAETIQFGDVAGTVITSPTGERVRIGDLATIEMLALSGPVTRENQRYTVNLNWEYVGTDRMRRSFIAQTLNGLDLPYGYEAKEGERIFFTEEEEQELTQTLALAVAFIFMVLAALFESVTLPLLVLTSVPLALVGVVMIFWLGNDTFDSSARIGLVLLFGIVVNNAILLVSRFRSESELILRAKLGDDVPSRSALFGGGRKLLGGVDLGALPKNERASLLRRAVARATEIRLRSILLTSGTTILGLAPLLIPWDEWLPWLPIPRSETQGADIWDNLARSSIGGLAASTVLLIVVLPALYYACVRIWWLVRGWIGAAVTWLASVLLAAELAVVGLVLVVQRASITEMLAPAADPEGAARGLETMLPGFLSWAKPAIAWITPGLGLFHVLEQLMRTRQVPEWVFLAAGVVLLLSALLLVAPRVAPLGALGAAVLLSLAIVLVMSSLESPGIVTLATLLVAMALAYARSPRPRRADPDPTPPAA